MMGEAELIGIGLVSLAAALFVWTAVSIFFLRRMVERAENALGAWRGQRFVYHQPQHVFTTEWSPADNGSPQVFYFKLGEPGAIVDYKIEIDGRNTNINCAVFGSYWMAPLDDMVSRFSLDRSGRVMLGRKRDLHLICHSKENALPSIVRVYVLAWETDSELLMDYTDRNARSRDD